MKLLLLQKRLRLSWKLNTKISFHPNGEKWIEKLEYLHPEKEFILK